MRRGLGFLGGQPDRPRPRAVGAHRDGCGHLPAGHDAARGQHGHRAVDGLDDLGNQHHRRHLAAVPAGLGALRDDEIHARRDLLGGVLLGADEGGDGNAALLARVDHVVRWHAQRVGDQLDRMAHRHLEQILARVAGQERRAEPDLFFGRIMSWAASNSATYWRWSSSGFGPPSLTDLTGSRPCPRRWRALSSRDRTASRRPGRRSRTAPGRAALVSMPSRPARRNRRRWSPRPPRRGSG